MRVFVAALVLLIALQGRSQDTVYFAPLTVPSLNGHEFVVLPLTETPMINTSFHTRLGLLSTNGIEIPLPDFLPDSLNGLSGDVLFVNLGFFYHQKIKDWIGFYAKIEVNVRSGTELGTILSEGINTLTGGNVGVVFKVIDRPRHFLSGTFEVSNYDATIINVRQFVRDLLEGAPDPSITQDAPALTVGLGARYAFAISKVIGLTALGRVLYGENIVRGDDAFRSELGASIDFNLKSKNIPIGLALGYQLSSAPELVYVEDKSARTIAIKIAYTAAPNFLLGVELNSTSIPLVSSDNRARALGANINVSYWFN